MRPKIYQKIQCDEKKKSVCWSGPACIVFLPKLSFQSDIEVLIIEL